MNMYPRRSAWLVLLAWLVMASLLWAQAATQPAVAAKEKKTVASAAETKGPKIGHVRGSNCNVRSGFHQNYYAVTQLNRGDEVTILGEEFGWLKIVPPAGTHSLIDRTYVDRLDDKTGVVNDAAQVYAGSNMNNQRYAKQVVLPKGARVEILGETSDKAFYKITPPAGAELWIKGDLVDQTGRLANLAQKKSPTPSNIEKVKPGELGLGGKLARPNAEVTPTPSDDKNVASMMDRNKNQIDVNAIEAEIAAERTKPLDQRSYESIVARLQPLAEQTEDETTQLYAKARIKQLHDQMGLEAAVREMRELKDQAIDTADALAARRALIQARQAEPMDDIIVRGEIRVSGLYDGSASRPKRWRVVDPDDGRTLAYIELAEGSPIDPVQYYGKYIGIRASQRRMLSGALSPIPIYTIQEIVVQDPAMRSKQPALGSVMTASPKPAEVSAPASQPAAAVDQNAPSNTAQ